MSTCVGIGPDFWNEVPRMVFKYMMEVLNSTGCVLASIFGIYELSFISECSVPVTLTQAQSRKHGLGGDL